MDVSCYVWLYMAIKGCALLCKAMYGSVGLYRTM